MIPYAIFMMKLIWKDGKSIEVRGLDPLDHGVRFRLSRSWKERMQSGPEKIQACFFDFDSKKYIKTVFTDYRIIKKRDEEELEALYYCMQTENKVFTQAFQNMLSQYWHYIRLKQDCSEIELMEQLTGLAIVDEEKNYADRIQTWKKSQIDTLHRKDPGFWNIGEVELGIVLDGPAMWKKFLQIDQWESFLRYYWKDNALEEHPIASEKITHIYVGNQFCPLLFPEWEELMLILNRIRTLGLKPVVVFSTMPEHLISARKEILMLLQEWEENPIEIVINDLGQELMLREMVKEGDIRENSFLSYYGILLHKMKKDSRMQLFGPDYDVCGDKKTVYLPLYQMNTGTFCPLYALCQYGDRGHQKEVKECPHYCKEYAIFYPDGLNQIGLGNSIFGFRGQELQDVGKLHELLSRGVNRIVVRL